MFSNRLVWTNNVNLYHTQESFWLISYRFRSAKDSMMPWLLASYTLIPTCLLSFKNVFACTNFNAGSGQEITICLQISCSPCTVLNGSYSALQASTSAVHLQRWILWSIRPIEALPSEYILVRQTWTYNSRADWSQLTTKSPLTSSNRYLKIA